MRKYFYYLLVLFLFSCAQSDKNKDAAPQLFQEPQSVELNTSEGYVFNSVTGDTIQVLVNSYGDTLQTGIELPIQERLINRDSFSSAIIRPIGKPKVVATNLNEHLIPEFSNAIKVDESTLKKINVKNNSSTFVLINTVGDTVSTGVPTKLTGKKVNCTFSKPIVAQAPRMKDNAINNMQYMDIDQGMNSSFVRAVLEDKNGNIWFATSGGGVSKFDGETFAHFAEKEGLSSNIVYSMLEDKNGNIWFGTVYGGLCKYDGESFTHYTEKEGLTHNDVMSIIEDKDGNIWFGMYGGGVGKFDGELFTFFTEKEGLSNNKVMSVYQDETGIFWFGTWGGGVNRFDGETFTHFSLASFTRDNGIYSILEEGPGKIWFGTAGGGATCYEHGTMTNFTVNEGISNDDVLSIMKDKDGSMWFGTSGGGVSKYDGKTFTNFTESEGLSNNYVMAMLQDESGIIWLATEGGGVSIYDPASFTHFTEESGLSNQYVLGMTEDKNKNSWFGTWGNGVNIYDGKSMTQYTTAEGMSNDVIWSIIEDKYGNIWMGTYGGGITCYDGKSFIHFMTDQGLSDNYVFTLLEDTDGIIWIGTWYGGITKFTPSETGKVEDGTFSHITEKEGLASNDVRSIIEDKNGKIWIATSGAGVSVIDGTTIKHYSEKEGLNHNTVWSLMEDNDGMIWLGTYGGGVSSFDGKTFTTYTDKEGLSDNYVMSVIENKTPNNSQYGNVFVSTSKGLNYLKKTRKNENDPELKSDYEISQYNYEDGLKALDFFYGSSFIDSKNRVWWGTGKALEMLPLNEFGISDKIPTPHLNRLDVNDYFVDYRLQKDSLQEFIEYNEVVPFENYPRQAEFDFSYNHLTFYFSAIDWAAPHKIRYTYRIPELGESWSQPSEKTAADYRNLSYGDFTFQVCAIGESRIWSEPFEYKFTILPPWYHTWWARTLYVMFSIFIVVFIIRWRTAKLKERQKELEIEVANATKEIRHQKEAVEQQKELIEEVHKEITDSINYAQRLQRSLMASKTLLDENLSSPSGRSGGAGGDYFIYFNPKEAVSGDFYWASKLKNGNFVLACADSTGHGVPGAIMSMMNMNSLKEAVKDGHANSDAILNQTRKTIIETLANDGSREGGKDGMDAALLIFNKEKTQVEFTIANTPLWLLRNGELIEYKPDKMPVGRHDKQDVPFTKTTIDLLKGDIIYIFTDGYADQFGGEKGKKFKYATLKELFIAIHSKPTEEQREALKNRFDNWRNNLEQVDDVCVIGVRI